MKKKSIDNLRIPPTSCIFILFSCTTGNINIHCPSSFLLYGLWSFTWYYKGLCLWGSLGSGFVVNCCFPQSNRNLFWKQKKSVLSLLATGCHCWSSRGWQMSSNIFRKSTFLLCLRRSFHSSTSKILYGWQRNTHILDLASISWYISTSMDFRISFSRSEYLSCSQWAAKYSQHTWAQH